METVMAQLGKAFGLILLAEAKEAFMHQDVSLWGAPSECHDLVSKGEFKRLRQARRNAKAVSGLSRAAFNKLAKGVTADNPQWSRAYSRIYNAHYPF
jgi:hypothetical protein